MSRRILGAFVIAAALAAPSLAFAATDHLAEAERLLAQGQLKAAEIELKNAVQSDPQNMLAHYRLAVLQLKLGEAAAAEHEAGIARAAGFDPEHTIPLLAEAYLAQQKYRQLLQDFPAEEGPAEERASLLVSRGTAQLALGKPDDARRSFQEAHTLAPGSMRPLLAEGNLLVSQRQFDAADALYDQALKIEPKSAEARLAKAHVLRLRGDAEKAQSSIESLLADEPEYLPARLEHAELLIAKGLDQPAKTDIDAILAAQPRNVPAIYLRAILAARAKDFQSAWEDLQKISAALPLISRGYYVQALVLYNLKELNQAEDSARRYTARNPDDLVGQKLLAVIEMALRHPAGAVDALAKFEADGKADAAALDLLGRAYAQLGNTAAALTAFDAAVKAAPDNAGLRLQLGATRLRAGETAEAITELEQSLELSPSAPAGELLVLTELRAGHWEDAIRAAEKLQQAQPDSPVAPNLLGLIKLQRFDLDGARTAFTGLMQRSPDFEPARLNLARVAELQGKYGEAEELLRPIVSKQPDDMIALNQLVTLLVHSGKTDQAVAALEAAHKAAPQKKEITATLITLYLQSGRKDDALALANGATESNDSTDVLLITARARAEAALALYDKAAQTYRRLIEIAPDHLDSYHQLAAVLVAARDFSGARQAIDQAMKLAPSNPQLAADKIAIEQAAGGVSAAVETARQLAQSNPGLPTVSALEGDAYLAAGDHQKAVEAYAKAFDQHPSAMLAIRLARARAAAGQTDKAVAGLRDWSAAHPDDTQAAALLGNFDIQAGKFPQATQELEAVIAKTPDDPVTLNNLAWLYQHGGDSRAEALAKRAYLLAPALAQTADTLGWILLQEGKATDAIGLLRQAGTNTKDPTIRYHLAVALNATGHQDEAKQLLTGLVKDDAAFADKPAAEKLLAQLSGK